MFSFLYGSGLSIRIIGLHVLLYARNCFLRLSAFYLPVVHCWCGPHKKGTMLLLFPLLANSLPQLRFKTESQVWSCWDPNCCNIWVPSAFYFFYCNVRVRLPYSAKFILPKERKQSLSSFLTTCADRTAGAATASSCLARMLELFSREFSP